MGQQMALVENGIELEVSYDPTGDILYISFGDQYEGGLRQHEELHEGNIDCRDTAGQQIGIRRRDLHWNQHWPATASPCGRRSASKTRP